MLILSLLRLKSVSSHPSPAGGAGAGSLGLLGIKAGGAFSWSSSINCSSCRTSSVFSLGNSPGTSVTFTTLRETIQSHIRMASISFKTISESQSFQIPLWKWSDTVVSVILPHDGSSLPCVLLRWCVCAAGEGRICSRFFPVIRLIFCYHPFFHAVFKYWH